jgi:hypothetical protein
MADRQSHIRQWNHNRRFVSTVSAEFPDWIITGVFYVALHAVDALLAHDKVSGVTSHEGRNRVLFETNRYSQIRKHYMPLYDLARTVRYLADPRAWVPPDQIEKNVVNRYLYPLERSVQKLIGEQIELAPLSLAKL